MSDQGVQRLSFSEALIELKGKQKTSKGAPAYSLLVNRRLGRFFAAVAYVLRRTPNQVTALSGLCSFTAIVMIAAMNPTPASSVLVCLLLVVGYALDAADGQLARLQGGGSVSGEWLDHVVDAIKIVTLHLAVLINWYRFSATTDLRLLVPLVFTAVSAVTFFVIILNDQIRRAQRNTTEMLLQGEGKSSRLYSLAVMPTDYGLLCLVFVALFWQSGFFWMYSALMAASLIFLALALVKWFREMSRY